ncbi:DUF2894 domain-containing protein [Dyella sp. 2RAB6]|uniref:DUF2894 domain-containing protein n=1 Tax=Dyella sp. 2RAB6 TaxID=3232992 RepID=UPI003F909209
MSEQPAQARARLDAWREQGAHGLDPVRFHVMEALEQRAATHAGEVRRLLDARLSALLDGYAAVVESAAAQAELAADTASDGSLRALAQTMANRGTSAFPELSMLGDFRQLWSGLRTESQLRQSLQPAPANTGPLNSSALAHRSIALMRELSPGYLRHFLEYVDALSWMEQIQADGAVAPVRKRSREKKAT